MTDPTDPILEDDLFWPIMVELRNCLEAKLAEYGGPELCEITIIPGDQIILDFGGDGDDCEGGMAWVRLVDVFPSTSFPTPDDTATCFVRMAAEIEVGVMRPAPEPDGRMMPTAAETFNAARLQSSDMRAMLGAIGCCMRARKETTQHVLNAYQPSGPDGTLVGGTFTVFAGAA